MRLIHIISTREQQTLDKLSNVIYDVISNDLDRSEERADKLALVAVNAMRKHMEDGH